MKRFRPLILALFVGLGLLALAGSVAAQDLLFGATGTGSGTGQLVRINPADGSFVVVGDLNDSIGNNYRLTGLAYDLTTGIMYGATNNNSPANPRSLVTVNLNTGQVTLLGSFGLGTQTLADITFRAGTLYGWVEASNDDFASVNLGTGAATIIGNSGLSTYGSGLAANSAGTIFFAGDGNRGDLRTVNPADGSTALIATLSGSPGTNDNPISALAFDSSNVLYGVDLSITSPNPAFLVTINTATGVVTNRGQTINRLDAIAFAPIPEPTSMALLGIAGAGMALVIRRRQNAR